MKKIIFVFVFSLQSIVSGAQCTAAENLFTSNTYYYSTSANWSPTTSDVYYYRIRYKELGATSWTFINNIDSLATSRAIVNLSALTDYIWQIKTYCDSTNTNTSNWSIVDTFNTFTNSCPNTSSLYASNINYNNVQANWDTVLNAHRYKVRYKILGTTNWLSLGPVYHPANNIIIPLLQQNTSYEWQVQTYHDTSSILASLWSLSDTFTTDYFVPAPFNPIISNTLSSLECNTTVDLFLSITQSNNEPDIGTSIITSDGGSFNISGLSFGDTVGHAQITTSNQVLTGTLISSATSQNQAVINSYDSAGIPIGFFIIENESGGVKVTSSSPNDGNDYTSGYTSEIHIDSLFINPPSAGALYFHANISSELNHQVYIGDTMQVWCNTSLQDFNRSEKTIIYKTGLLGKMSKKHKKKLEIIRLSDGTIIKKLVIQQ